MVALPVSLGRSTLLSKMWRLEGAHLLAAHCLCCRFVQLKDARLRSTAINTAPPWPERLWASCGAGCACKPRMHAARYVYAPCVYVHVCMSACAQVHAHTHRVTDTRPCTSKTIMVMPCILPRRTPLRGWPCAGVPPPQPLPGPAHAPLASAWLCEQDRLGSNPQHPQHPQHLQNLQHLQHSQPPAALGECRGDDVAWLDTTTPRVAKRGLFLPSLGPTTPDAGHRPPTHSMQHAQLGSSSTTPTCAPRHTLSPALQVLGPRSFWDGRQG